MLLKHRNNHHSHDYTLEVKTLFFLPSEVTDTICGLVGFFCWFFFCMCVHLPFITGNLLMSASQGDSDILSLKQEFRFSFRFSIHKRYHRSLLYKVYAWKKTAVSLISDYYASMSVHYFGLNNYILFFIIKV